MRKAVNNSVRFAAFALFVLGALTRSFIATAQTEVPRVAPRTSDRPIGGKTFTAGPVITANFMDKTIGPRDRLVLKVDPAPDPVDGAFHFFIGTADLTALFRRNAGEFIYTPDLFPLSLGEIPFTVYRSETSGAWQEVARFSLNVGLETGSGSSPSAAEGSIDDEGTPFAEAPVGDGKEFTPTVAVNIKGQNQIRTFPRESEPERNPFTEADTQIGLELSVSRRGWSLSTKFDFVGVGHRPNALRFAELQNEAPQIDLSSYLIEVKKDRLQFNLGHVSFGSNRHVINSFSSRGITATIPVTKQDEIQLAAMNGTSIVGYDNFLGVSRRNHQVLSAGYAREFFKERPNGLRFEFTVMRGSLLPITNVNQGAINDAETSLGFGFRVRGSDTKERLRYEAGISRSRFVNPADPLLEQGQELTPMRRSWETARFAEISFDIFQDLKVWKEKSLKLTGTYRHEEIEPLYRSIGVSVQADKRQDQLEFSGNLGEFTFAFGNLRDRDNLNDILSILTTRNRRANAVFAVPLGTFFTPAKPVKWLPQISYNFEFLHQFGVAFPTEGGFDDPSQIPDQKNYTRAFNAQWALSDSYSLGYTYNRVFQNNRQPGREIADLRSTVHGVTFGMKPWEDLDLDLELSEEAQENFEQQRIDRSVRVGARAAWRTVFLPNSIFSGGLTVTVAGDDGNNSDARNAEFDLQWAYRFTLGKKKFKKLDTQFFIRYSNRYGNTIDRIQVLNSFNKTQAFNMGLTFNIF
ncbi:MAG: hypothetical protein IPM25_15550 [Chloracidobacterium sp.]|nr:hypothetical protein [Chloracidobacterium sp.]